MTYFHSFTLLYTSMFAIVIPKCLAHVPYRSWNSHRCQVHRYVSVLANVGGQCTLPHLPIGRQLEAATRRRATVKGWFSNGSKRCFQDTIDYLVGGLEHLLFVIYWECHHVSSIIFQLSNSSMNLEVCTVYVVVAQLINLLWSSWQAEISRLD